MSNSIFIDEYTRPLLSGISFFRELDEAVLQKITEEIIVRRYQAGELIFLEGDPCSGLYLVIEGLCKIYRLSDQGREHVLITLGRGDSCNEVSVVDGGPNPVNFAAIEATITWVITPQALARLRKAYPGINEIIIKTLAIRCRQLVEQVYNLSFLSVTERLAAFLLEKTDATNILSRRKWTQDEIAAHLGTVREMVGRSLRELQEEELISVNRHQIEIVDETGLIALT